jgi:hypothetical protein
MFKNKYTKLAASIALDAIGMATPFFVDLLWAPVSGYLMSKMYDKSKLGKTASWIVTIEELIPGLDFIPTFTLMWLYTYVYKPETETQPQLKTA